MPHWKPKPFWKGKDVYIIGGGSSLKGFNWSLLRNVHTIGCNDAFLLGSKICSICIFGDLKWWDKSRDSLLKFDGLVVTHARKLRDNDISWLWTMRRIPKGLDEEALAWNGNTGASAINLALILGAKQIFLLGFDMKLKEGGENNWYDKKKEDIKKMIERYERFLKGFDSLIKDWKIKFPDRKIFNLTEDSNLNVFPKLSLQEHFEECKI